MKRLEIFLDSNFCTSNIDNTTVRMKQILAAVIFYQKNFSYHIEIACWEILYFLVVLQKWFNY